MVKILPLQFLSVSYAPERKVVVSCSLLVLPLHADDADYCDNQHCCQHRQGGGKCKDGLILAEALFLTFVPIVPPVVSYLAPRQEKKMD